MLYHSIEHSNNIAFAVTVVPINAGGAGKDTYNSELHAFSTNIFHKAFPVEMSEFSVSPTSTMSAFTLLITSSSISGNNKNNVSNVVCIISW